MLTGFNGSGDRWCRVTDLVAVVVVMGGNFWVVV